jgi:glucokinase
MKVAAGIDIGGTNAAAAIVTEDGNILNRFNFPIKNFPAIENLVDELAIVLLDYCKENNVELNGIGIGAPNGNFYSGSIEFAPNLPWKGIIPLAKMFEEKCHVKVWLTNDANAAAIGEMIFGAVKGKKDFLMITLGTGLGSGIVANGKLIYGHDGLAGEVGHTIAIRGGRQCGCGRRGCLETYCSANGIVKTVKGWLKEGKPSTLQNVDFENISSKQIYEAAENNDALALEAFRFTSEILGIALADAVAFTSPDTIVLFGGLVNAGNLIIGQTKYYMEQNLLHIYKNKVEIIASKLPESDAAILGAASLVWNEIN